MHFDFLSAPSWLICFCCGSSTSWTWTYPCPLSTCSGFSYLETENVPSFCPSGTWSETETSSPASSPSRPGPTPAPTSAATEPLRGFRSPIFSHLDPEVSSFIHAAVQSIHRVLGVPLVIKPDKGKAPAFSGDPVLGDEDVPDLAVFLE